MSNTVLSLQSVLTADNSPFNNAMDASARKVESAFGRMHTAAVTALGSGVIREFIRASKAANEFGQKLADIASISEFNMQKVRSSILAMGNEYGRVSRIADSMYETISSGIRGSEAEIANYVKTAAAAAKAIRADVYSTASVMTTLANAYAMPAKEVTKIADMLFVAVREGKASGQDFSRTLGLVSNTAAEAGVRLEELGVAAAVLSRTQSASQSLIGLNQLLNSIIKPTQEAAAEARYWGIELNATALKTKGLAAILTELHDKTGGNVRAINAMLGNIRAMRAGVALTGSQYENFIEVLEKARTEIGAGVHAKAFEIQTKTAQQALLNFQAQADKTRIQIGTDFEEINKALYNFGEAFLKSFSDSGDNKAHTLARWVTYLSAASVAVSALIKGSRIVSNLSKALEAAALAANDTANNLNKSGVSTEGLNAGVKAVNASGDKVNAAFNRTSKAVGKINAGIVRLNNGLMVTVALAEKLLNAMNGVRVPSPAGVPTSTGAPTPAAPVEPRKIGFGTAPVNTSKNPINLRGLKPVPALNELPKPPAQTSAELMQRARASLHKQQDAEVAKVASGAAVAEAQRKLRGKMDYDLIRRQVTDRNMRAYLAEQQFEAPRGGSYTKFIPGLGLSKGAAAKAVERLVNEKGMSRFNAIMHVAPHMRDAGGFRFKGGASSLGAGTMVNSIPNFAPFTKAHFAKMIDTNVGKGAGAGTFGGVFDKVKGGVTSAMASFGKGMEATKTRIAAIGTSFAKAGNATVAALGKVKSSLTSLNTSTAGLSKAIGKGMTGSTFTGAVGNLTSKLGSVLGTIGLWGMAGSMVYNFAKTIIDKSADVEVEEINKESEEKTLLGWKDAVRKDLAFTKQHVPEMTEAEYGRYQTRIADKNITQAELSRIADELRAKRRKAAGVSDSDMIVTDTKLAISAAEDRAKRKYGNATSSQAAELDVTLRRMAMGGSSGKFTALEVLRGKQELGVLAPDIEGVSTASATLHDSFQAKEGDGFWKGAGKWAVRNHLVAGAIIKGAGMRAGMLQKGTVKVNPWTRIAIQDALSGPDPKMAADDLNRKYKAAYGENSEAYRVMAGIVDSAYNARVKGYDASKYVKSETAKALSSGVQGIADAEFKKFNDYTFDPDTWRRNFIGEQRKGAHNQADVRVFAKLGAMYDEAKAAPDKYRTAVHTAVKKLPGNLSPEQLKDLEVFIAANSGTTYMQAERLGKQRDQYEQTLTLSMRDKMHGLRKDAAGKVRNASAVGADMRKVLEDQLRSLTATKDTHIQRALRIQAAEVISQLDSTYSTANEKRKEALTRRKNAGLISEVDVLRDDVRFNRSMYSNELNSLKRMRGDKRFGTEAIKTQELRVTKAQHGLMDASIKLKKAFEDVAVTTRTKLMSSVVNTFTEGRDASGRVSNDALYHSLNLVSRMGGGDMIQSTNGVSMGVGGGKRVNFRNAQDAQTAVSRQLDAYIMSQQYAEANSGKAVIDIYNILKQNVGKGVIVL